MQEQEFKGSKYNFTFFIPWMHGNNRQRKCKGKQ